MEAKIKGIRDLNYGVVKLSWEFRIIERERER